MQVLSEQEIVTETNTAFEVVCMLGFSVATYSSHMTWIRSYIVFMSRCVTKSYLTGINKLFQYYKLKLVRKSALKQLCLRPSYI